MHAALGQSGLELADADVPLERGEYRIELMIAALAPPSVRPAAMWSTVPAPPDAITGTFTASATARVIVSS